MVDSAPPRDPFENLISLAAGPISAVIRSFDQLRRGSDELFKGLENFNRTMANLNDTAERVNALLNEFEGPVRAVMPQVLATARLAEQLTPVIATLPTDLTKFIDSINDLSRRLAPLGQLAETAGGLFSLRIPGMPRPSASPAQPPAVAPAPPTKPKAAAKKSSTKKSATKKSATKKRPASR
jgi:ABC-type transporter Mla subunit MlaD